MLVYFSPPFPAHCISRLEPREASGVTPTRPALTVYVTSLRKFFFLCKVHLFPMSVLLLSDFGLFRFLTMNSFSLRHKLQVVCPVLYAWLLAMISHFICDGSSDFSRTWAARVVDLFVRGYRKEDICWLYLPLKSFIVSPMYSAEPVDAL